MTTADHLLARRRAQAIARIWRHVRKLRQRGKLTEADAEVRAFRCGDVLAVPSDVWKAWTTAVAEVEGTKLMKGDK